MSGPGVKAFETGPIRPPSEARSLLVRVTRNCPWNRCEFCPVYKGTHFSKRTVAEVKADVEAMLFWREQAVMASWRLGFGGRLDQAAIAELYRRSAENPYLRQILVWLSGGGVHAFLQDADNLILKPEDLAAMLTFLRATFPELERVTTYGRSRTIAKRTLDELKLLKAAGLDRVHVGLESGSDRALARVDKGVTAELHVQAGRLVKAAGLELSEYVMPGLGGRDGSRENALETARVLNLIDPDFIRVRSLGVGENMPLHQRVLSGEFQLATDEEIARELRLLVASLEVNSDLVSDHILNLLPRVEGRLPRDKELMLAVIDRFLELPDEDRLVYVVGRRLGLFEDTTDLADPDRAAAARRSLAIIRDQAGPDVHAALREIASRFI